MAAIYWTDCRNGESCQLGDDIVGGIVRNRETGLWWWKITDLDHDFVIRPRGEGTSKDVARGLCVATASRLGILELEQNA